MADTKYLFVGAFDWANVCNRVARAINASVGERIARVFTKPHPFEYEEQDAIHPGFEHAEGNQGVELVKAAKTAQWFISTDDGDGYELMGSMMANLPLPRTVRTATVHTGTTYRDNPDWFNKADAKIGFDRRIIGGDLYRFAQDNYASKAVPFFAPPHRDPIKELPPLPEQIRIGHSPSSRTTKGTDDILKALQGFNVDVIEGVSFDECAKRRADCQIFVDQLKPELGGYGASAVEAMAVGCAVIASTNNIVTEVDKFYPPPPIIPGFTQGCVRKHIEELLAAPDVLQSWRQRSLDWCRHNATQEAIADYWMEVLR